MKTRQGTSASHSHSYLGEYIDPRYSIIGKRIGKIHRILAFASGKGGVGKSSCSVITALTLAERGRKTGLLDLDFHGASDHIFLNTDLSFPEESGGILPIKSAYDLLFMSIASFTGERGVPLRGSDITDAFLELLAVTIWGELDYLVIDMPPGIGDEVLDLIRFLPGAEVIIVSTPSVVSARVVNRLLNIFLELGTPVRGIIENMRHRDGKEGDSPVKEMPGKYNSVPFLGSIPRYDDFEESIGSPEKLLSCNFGKAMSRIVSRIQENHQVNHP